MAFYGRTLLPDMIKIYAGFKFSPEFMFQKKLTDSTE